MPGMVHDAAADKLKQERMRAASLSNGEGPWTVICDDWHYDSGDNGGRFVAFANPSIRNQVLKNTSWDLTKGGGGPGFSRRPENGDWVKTYERNIDGPHVEPLVILQDFYGVVDDRYLISEEFVLLMRLWEDRSTGNYFEIKDDGSKELAIEFDGKRIRIRTPLLRRYQAARQLDLLLFTDSITFVQTDEDSSLFESVSEDLHLENGTNQVWISVGDIHTGDDRVFSRLMVKRLLPPPPQEASGIWPWDDLDETDPEFIIDEDTDGRPVRYVCDPEQLANFFGKNPEAPNYLTPVFFRPEVLQRYYGNLSLYSVREGYLSCASLWRVRIDNYNPEHVMVFLGDLGRDLPESERTHWLAHNVAPAGRHMSEANFRRSFLAQWANTTNPEHTLKQTYSKLRETWRDAWGWDLYRAPTGADTQIIERLRIPLNDSDGEFEAQILNLAKLLIDLLNESRLVAGLPPIDKGKGISKFESFLSGRAYVNVDRDVKLLRRIQNLRSKLAAHTSGASGQTLLATELDGLTKAEFVKMLMTEATQMLHDLSEFVPPVEDKA